jgi:hypothetical protein
VVLVALDLGQKPTGSKEKVEIPGEERVGIVVHEGSADLGGVRSRHREPGDGPCQIGRIGVDAPSRSLGVSGGVDVRFRHKNLPRVRSVSTNAALSYGGEAGARLYVLSLL